VQKMPRASQGDEVKAFWLPLTCRQCTTVIWKSIP
jgi:hypothetical protein